LDGGRYITGHAVIQKDPDGGWHNVIAMRVCDRGGRLGRIDPPPQTGTYIEEVYSTGKPIPIWRF
jgi:3-polyprenyl-4-hydroxybenzoate decarboxylase